MPIGKLDMMFHVPLPLVKLILLIEHLGMLLCLFLYMLDLMIINRIHPKGEARQLLIKISVEFPFMNAERSNKSPTPSQRWPTYLSIISRLPCPKFKAYPQLL